MRTNEKVETLFKTDLGWFGLSWSEQALKRVTFGHRTKPAARAELITSPRGSLELLPPSRLSTAQQELVQRLRDYTAGAATDFRDVPIQLGDLTPFQLRVLRVCRQIRWGETRTYGELAAQAGFPGAAPRRGHGHGE